jgi:hypothetical protein
MVGVGLRQDTEARPGAQPIAGFSEHDAGERKPGDDRHRRRYDAWNHERVLRTYLPIFVVPDRSKLIAAISDP